LSTPVEIGNSGVRSIPILIRFLAIINFDSLFDILGGLLLLWPPK
jgi:hypothetical protein